MTSLLNNQTNKPAFMKKNHLQYRVLLMALLPLILFSCSKSKNTANSGTYYFKANIGGKSYNVSATSDGKIIAGSGVDGTDDVVIFGTIDNTIDFSEFAVSKGIMHNFLSAAHTDMKNFFNAGTYNFSVDAQSGVEISWTDATGKYWSTSIGSGDETGSTFKILSVVDDPDALGKYYVKVKSQFNCTLYDDSGNSMPLTGGEMAGDFGPLN